MVEREDTGVVEAGQGLPELGDACEDVEGFFAAYPECVRRHTSSYSARCATLSAEGPGVPGDACESLAAYFWDHVQREKAKAVKRRAALRGSRAAIEASRERRGDGAWCREVPENAARLSPCVRRNNCNVPTNAGAPAFERGSYLGEVEHLTRGFRAARAAAFDAAAAAARAERLRDEAGGLVGQVERTRRVYDAVRARKVARKVLVPAAAAQEARARWNDQRANGQRSRFGSLQHCGEGAVNVSCVCGDARPAVLGCDVRRLCVRCRDASAVERRERFARARGVLLARSSKLGHFRRVRRNGRYSEKHLTLTLPDAAVVGSGAVGWRVAVLFAAWRSFSQRLLRYFRERKERVTYFRGFEWTAGADGLGHPHFHVWMWSPFLPVALVRRWWALSLHEQGVLVFGCGEARAAATGPRGRARRGAWPIVYPVIVDVREVKVRRAAIRFEIIKGGKAVQIERPRLVLESVGAGGGVDVVGYVEGWVLQEVDTNGRPVPPEVLSELYEALECRRQTQASAGFLGLGERECSCPACGLVGGFQVEVVPWWDGEIGAKRAAIGLPARRAGPADRAGPGLRKVGQKTGWAQLRLVG